MKIESTKKIAGCRPLTVSSQQSAFIEPARSPVMAFPPQKSVPRFSVPEPVLASRSVPCGSPGKRLSSWSAVLRTPHPTPDELAAIHERMAEVGISNAGAYVRKMALNGYILHIDLAPVKELISLQRRCSNNLNQVAIHAHTYGVYPEEIDKLKRDYEKLWGEVSKVLRKLSELVAK